MIKQRSTFVSLKNTLPQGVKDVSDWKDLDEQDHDADVAFENQCRKKADERGPESLASISDGSKFPSQR